MATPQAETPRARNSGASADIHPLVATPQRRPRVSLWFVGMQKNLHELPALVHLGADLGVPEVYLQRLVYFGSVTVQGDHPWQGCYRPWTLIYVTANGNLLPCCIAPFAAPDYPGIVLGSLAEQPLAALWNNQRYQELRAAVLSTSPMPWPCQHCGVKWSL